TGLLIEHDGHIISENDTIKQIREDINNPAMKLFCPEKFIVSAVFQKYGIKNANGRIYPENILKREVEKYLEERVANRASFAALDHPNYSSLSGHDVAHIITDLYWEGHTLVGETEIHTSPGFRHYGVCSTSGDLLANLLISGCLVGVSSRGVGSVKQMPGDIVVVDEDFSLLTFDAVLEPSTPNAYIRNTQEELKPFIESVTNNKTTINEKIKKINKILI
ncbi:MAG: hypothetical protein K2H20_00460, partial [Bacilli bacterium]|nr:hypothetical protein [Bacilli bacterium]